MSASEIETIEERLENIEAILKRYKQTQFSSDYNDFTVRFEKIEEQIQALEPLRHLEGFSRFLEQVKVRLDPKQEVVVFDLDKVMKCIEKDLEESESETEDY